MFINLRNESTICAAFERISGSMVSKMNFELCSTSQKLEFFAEFNATEESLKNDVWHLKDWLTGQPHLPEITDEDWLANFLLRSKNNVEKAKRLLENYYVSRAKMPEIFQDRDYKFLDKIEQMKQFGAFCPLPKLTPEGHRLMIFRIYKDEHNHNIPRSEDMLKVLQIVFDISLKTDVIRGIILIYDLENLNFHLIRIFLPILRKIMTIQSKMNPVRYNKIFLLNLVVFAQPLVTFAKGFVKKQNEKLVVWSKKSKELATVLPPECLPKEYGGSLPPIKELVEVFFEFGMKQIDWLQTEENVKADLSKKPLIRRRSSMEILRGVGESIKKLVLD